MISYQDATFLITILFSFVTGMLVQRLIYAARKCSEKGLLCFRRTKGQIHSHRESASSTAIPRFD